MLPREEEPQIKVPMVDVVVQMPGFSAKEVEERATRPMEKLLWEIPGRNTSTLRPLPERAVWLFVSKWGRTQKSALCVSPRSFVRTSTAYPRGLECRS